MSRTIIAFAGSKCSGKTTAFNTLKQLRNDVHELTLAGHLKNICSQVFEIEEKYFHDQNLKEAYLDIPVCLEIRHVDNIIRLFGYEPDFDLHIRKHLNKVLHTPRQILQYIGTEVLREVNQAIHVDHAAKNMPKSGLIVITDLRFVDEFNYFANNHSKEFKPVYIKNSKAELMAESDSHPSEKQLHEFKHKCECITNEGSLLDFQTKIKNFANGLKNE